MFLNNFFSSSLNCQLSCHERTTSIDWNGTVTTMDCILVTQIKIKLNLSQGRGPKGRKEKFSPNSDSLNFISLCFFLWTSAIFGAHKRRQKGNEKYSINLAWFRQHDWENKRVYSTLPSYPHLLNDRLLQRNDMRKSFVLRKYLWNVKICPHSSSQRKHSFCIIFMFFFLFLCPFGTIFPVVK